MNKDLIKLAMIGLTAGLCVSAQAAPSNSKEVAMSKCTKDGNAQQCNSNTNSCNSSRCRSGRCGTGGGSCGGSYNDEDTDNQTTNMKNRRKSAAQRVVEGS